MVIAKKISVYTHTKTEIKILQYKESKTKKDSKEENFEK